jgi:hypothetical protein
VAVPFDFATAAEGGAFIVTAFGGALLAAPLFAAGRFGAGRAGGRFGAAGRAWRAGLDAFARPAFDVPCFAFAIVR